MDSSIARQTWELENNIVSVEPNSSSAAGGDSSDGICYYDEVAQAKFQQENPWAHDPNYFRRVRISALALLKMVVHARSGGTIEVMGLMQGKTDGDTIVVMDAFALPVEGTETRVNAQADAYEYMVDYSQANKQEESQLAKITRDSSKITVEQVPGLMSQCKGYQGHPLQLCAAVQWQQVSAEPSRLIWA